MKCKDPAPKATQQGETWKEQGPLARLSRRRESRPEPADTWAIPFLLGTVGHGVTPPWLAWRDGALLVPGLLVTPP